MRVVYQIGRDRDGVARMQAAAFNKRARTRSEIEIVRVQIFSPGVIVLVGVDEEQPFDFHAAAFLEQGFEKPRAKIGETFEYCIDIVKAFMDRQFIQHFEDRPFGR